MANLNDGKHNFILEDNYIYFYHLGAYILIPSYMVTSITDSNSVSFNSTPILSGTAPIQSYSHSGPRSVGFQFELHRDMMQQINYNNAQAMQIYKGLKDVAATDDEDYVDVLIRYIQASAYPVFKDAQKMVKPPMVAVRMGSDVFIKGIINGAVTVGYAPPILNTGHYARVTVGFSVTETDPYDAEKVLKTGSFRTLNTTLERNFWH